MAKHTEPSHLIAGRFCKRGVCGQNIEIVFEASRNECDCFEAAYVGARTIKAIFSAYFKNLFHKTKQQTKMHGHPLRVLATDGQYPLIYNYTTKDGSTIPSGNLGRSLVEYAYRHNATLVCPISFLNSINLTIAEILGNYVPDIIDISANANTRKIL